MTSLEGTRTDEDPRQAFSDEGRFNRIFLSFEQGAEAEGHRDLSVKRPATTDSGVGSARGHLDFPVACYDTTRQLGQSAANTITAMTDEYAGMARTAHDEGFDQIAGRSHARQSRRALENTT
jgi:hypothetical protein